MIQIHYYGPPMSAISAWRCVYSWPTCVFMFVCSPTCVCIYICISYTSETQFKTLYCIGFRSRGNSDTDVCAATQKGDSNLSGHYLSPIQDLNGWINKSLFRIVFGEGIVPAVQPLGPWLELRESTLCNTPGGYEEQMSCLLLSSSRLKAAHTSLKMTS